MPEEEKPEEEEEKKADEGEAPAPAPAPQEPKTPITINLGPIEFLFSTPFLLLGIVLGVFLRFLGAILFNFDASNSASAFIFNLGTLLLLLTLFGGAVMNDKVDPYVRLGMLFASGFIGFNTVIY